MNAINGSDNGEIMKSVSASELKLLNDLWKILEYMMEVSENEKAEAKAFKKVYRDLQRAYPTKIAHRKFALK